MGGLMINNTIKTSSEIGREFLIEHMKGSYVENISELSYETETEYKNEKIEDIEEPENQLDIFLENILSECKENCKQKGNRISAYYLPELTKDVMRLCKDFTLWTSVLKIHFQSPYDVATSASVEGEFKVLKCTIYVTNKNL